MSFSKGGGGGGPNPNSKLFGMNFLVELINLVIVKINVWTENILSFFFMEDLPFIISLSYQLDKQTK